MKLKRQSLVLLGSFLLIIVITLFSPGASLPPAVRADGGTGGRYYFPSVRNDPTRTPTRTPTITFTPTVTSTSTATSTSTKTATPTATSTKTPTPTPTLTPEQSGSLPLPSTSYYVKSLDLAAAQELGCQLGTRDYNKPGKQESVVVLAFAYPMFKNGAYGAYTYVPGIDFASVDAIASVVEKFGYGYWYCVGSDFDSHLHVAVGTANHKAPSYSSVTYGHGQAWSQMVIDVDTWFTSGSGCPRGCDGQVNALGASDIELSWNAPGVSSDWVSGYASVPGLRGLINFGALEGCPTLSNPGAQCGSYSAGYLWSKDQVLEVTARSYIYPLPEIYLTNGVHAQQWYLMSKYAANAGYGPMKILGPLTEYQACLQRGGCNFSGVGINNSPQQAWDQLFPLINGDPQTRVWMGYASDMKWQGEKDVPFPYSSPLSLGQALTPVPGGSLPSTWPKALTLPVVTPAPVTDLLSLPPRIVDVSKALVHAWEGDIRNAWEGPYNGQYLYVLAGSAPENANQGLIIFDAMDPVTLATSRAYFLAPSGVGPLRILSVDGSQVNLVSERGDVLRFDLSTKLFH